MCVKGTYYVVLFADYKQIITVNKIVTYLLLHEMISVGLFTRYTMSNYLSCRKLQTFICTEMNVGYSIKRKINKPEGKLK